MGQGLEMSVSHVFEDGAHFSEQINSENLPYNIQNMDGKSMLVFYLNLVENWDANDISIVRPRDIFMLSSKRPLYMGTKVKGSFRLNNLVPMKMLRFGSQWKPKTYGFVYKVLS